MAGDELDGGAHLPRDPTPGSVELFERLYADVAPSLYAWARIRIDRGGLTGTGGMDAEDLLQEVWTRAIQGFGAFDAERSSFRAWTLGIAKHVLLEEFRRRKPSRLPAPGHSGSGSRFERCPDSVTSIVTRLSRDEGLQAFLDSVRALDPMDGLILLHHGFEDFTLTQTATRLGLSAELVKKRWQRLRAKVCSGGIGTALLPRAE